MSRLQRQLVLAEWRDDLQANGQIVFVSSHANVYAGQAHERPQLIENRIAGGFQRARGRARS